LRSRLGGWQRIGIVVSVLWAIGAGVTTRVHDASEARYMYGSTYDLCIEQARAQRQPTIKNEGKTPAWISSITFWMQFYDSLPARPDRHAIHTFGIIGPDPVSVGEPFVILFQPTCRGTRKGIGSLSLVIYGVVFYRDAFGENYETWCAYSVVGPLDSPRLERLAGYPEYNKNT